MNDIVEDCYDPLFTEYGFSPVTGSHQYGQMPIPWRVRESARRFSAGGAGCGVLKRRPFCGAVPQKHGAFAARIQKNGAKINGHKSFKPMILLPLLS
jgi:hypothetical protein